MGATGLQSSALGFGCAGAFRLPQAAQRRRLLDAAYDAGITHFDVAPMYGMGRAEAELAEPLGRWGDRVTVATKFGILPTSVGQLAGRVQGPIRSLLARRPDANTSLQQRAAGPSASAVGRLLYRHPGYGPSAMAASLERSIAALRRGTIDLFLLHDPPPEALAADGGRSFEALEAERAAGRIRCWGIAAHEIEGAGPAASAFATAPFLQLRDDAFRNPIAPPGPDQGIATYGALAGTLGRLESHLAGAEERRRYWVGALDLEERGPRSLAAIVLRAAVHRNERGPVLFTTTKPDRIFEAVEAVSTAPLGGELESFDALVAEAQAAP